MGHSGAGALQEVHGAALLSQRSRCALRVRRDVPGQLRQPGVLGGGVQAELARTRGPQVSAPKTISNTFFQVRTFGRRVPEEELWPRLLNTADSESVGFVAAKEADTTVAKNATKTFLKNCILLYLLRFLVGNKSDLRDPRSSSCQVNQERALSFARAHNMMFFETSAKNPPRKRFGDGQSEGEAPFQQVAVEDIVMSVGAKLKRQKRPSAVTLPAYSGSFKVTSSGIAEKEPWMCC